MACNPASIRPEARRMAEEAARRAGASIEDWLDEAIIGRVAREISDEAGAESGASGRLGRAWSQGADDSESPSARIERRLRLGEERMARALETMAKALERMRDNLTAETPSRTPRRPQRQATTALSAIDADCDFSDEQPTPLSRLDQRLEEIARRIEAARHSAREPKPSFAANSEKPRVDLRAAVSQIALRQQSLDSREPLTSPPAAPASPATDGGGRARSNCAPSSPDDPGRSSASSTSADAEERTDEDATGDRPSGSGILGKISHGIADRFAGKSGHFSRERPQRLCAIDLAAMREGIADMNRSLAELAPRNSVVALEGVVRDLIDRVAMLRQVGERESLLAPLEAMAAELRACLKSYDPRTVVAGLEREISALADKMETFAETAINPETFDRIQQQTEEVRNLLASAVTRSAPLERLERQIGILADRIEQLGASPAPQAESAELAASLAELRKEIERATPPSALAPIERRLEQIAARLDEEAFQQAQKGVEPYTLEDLAHRIDEVRQSLEASAYPRIDTSAMEASLKEFSARIADANSGPLAALMRDINDKLNSLPHGDTEADANAIEPRLAEIIDKLDRLPRADSVSSLQSIERLLQSLDAKLDLGAEHSLAGEIVSRIAEEVTRRLETNYPFHLDAQRLGDQIAYVRDSLAALSGLDGMPALMRTLSIQLAAASGEPVSNGEDGRGVRVSPVDSSRRESQRTHSLEANGASGGLRQFDEETSTSSSADDDVLLEPGAGKPNSLREARDPHRDTGSKTNSSISAHIAAARRAAHSASSEVDSHNVPAAAPSVTRGAERGKGLYRNHRRSVLIGVAFAIVALAAMRLVALHTPMLQKSDLTGHPTKTADVGASYGKAGDAVVASPSAALQADKTPIASIAPFSKTVEASQGPIDPKISASMSAALPAALRDAVAAGSPAAQYEVAQRLFEGRGVPQDQQAAALWFERAASSGLAPAQFRLATIYSKGVGVQRDAAAAKRWYAKAAEAGNARAAHNLAVLYAEPVGETPDYVEAAKWFRKAAELGVRDSQYNLAILYARGLGVEQDLAQSWMWFSLAASQGDADAAKKRGEVAAKMSPNQLAAAAEDLAQFKILKLDPAANEAPAPAAGWDGKGSLPPAGASASTTP